MAVPEECYDKTIDRLRSIAAEVLETDPDEIDIRANFYADLGASSLEKAEILARIEREFSVTLMDGSIETMDSLDDAMAVVGMSNGARE
ncbi:acyl carrier protein [Nocardia sp. NPDC057227]|uniref:acyl carrier protein n=1 Tax=Nocardia sp. NPDC057227 TaxID=3346056 RepID=UPI00363A5789